MLILISLLKELLIRCFKTFVNILELMQLMIANKYNDLSIIVTLMMLLLL